MKQVVGRALREVLSGGGGVGSRPGGRVVDVIRRGRLHRGVFAGFEGWRCRSMRPAQVTRRRRQSRRIGWDRARIDAAVMSNLGISRLVSVNMRMGRI